METDQLPLVSTPAGPRTSTPTAAVRSRPRPPSILAVSGLPMAATVPRRTISNDQPDGMFGGCGARSCLLSSGDDLSGVHPDYIRKLAGKAITTKAVKLAGIESISAGSNFTGSGGESLADSDGDTCTSPPEVGHTSNHNHNYNQSWENSPETSSSVSSGTDQRSLTNQLGVSRAANCNEDEPSYVCGDSFAMETPDENQLGAGSGRKTAVNLFRSESDASSVRSFRLRSLRPASEIGTGNANLNDTSGTLLKPWRLAYRKHPVEELSCSAETDDEGVYLDGSSVKETQLSTMRSSNRDLSASVGVTQNQRNPTSVPPFEAGHSNRLRTEQGDLTGKTLMLYEVASNCVSEETMNVGGKRNTVGSSISQIDAANPLIRKNSKTGKPKSRSDPSGEGSDKKAGGGIGSVDIPSIVYGAGSLHAQSSPVLCNTDESRTSGRGFVRLDDITRTASSSLDTTPTMFPFGIPNQVTNNVGDSASSLSDRERDSRSMSDDLSVGANLSSNFDRDKTMHDVQVHVVMKSDDSFDGIESGCLQSMAITSLTPMAVKPPRPRAMKKRPRASPHSPLSAVSSAASSTQLAVSEPSPPTAPSLVRKVFARDRNGTKQQQERSNFSSETDIDDSIASRTSTTILSSLTLPLQKKSSLLRSHSSASAEMASAAAAGQRTGSVFAEGAVSSSSSSPTSSTTSMVRRHSPGADDAPNVSSVTVCSGTGLGAPSSSVPELYSGGSAGTSAASSSTAATATTTSVSGTPARVRVRSVTSGSVSAAIAGVSGIGPGVHPFAPISLDPFLSRSTINMLDGTGVIKDKRDMIMQEFYSTEHQYVDTLKMLVERYMIPMKIQNIVDSSIVDDIFYKINEIYVHHATFLTFLARALRDWDSNTTIGDVIEKNFSKQTVIESYMSFIEHFPRAEKVLDEVSTKSSFQKFIEQCERDTRTKLPLKAQIVKPAQRIPRYELLLKRLLDNTSTSHPDHALLTLAEKTIHELALRINSVKESKHEEDLQETVKKIELLLITDLAVPDRIYLRHDMITLSNRKDQQYCLWLFNDLAVFSCVKRKQGSVSRRTSVLLQSPNGHDFVENTKHKLWLKLPLESTEMTHVDDEALARQMHEKQDLESDAQLLGQIIELTLKLKSPHQLMEDAMREVLGQVTKQLAEYQLKMVAPELQNSVELVVQLPDGIQTINVLFPSMDKKASWEAAFTAAKQKLAQATDGRPPELLQSLQITKTRAGMQFSCASLSEPDVPVNACSSEQSRRSSMAPPCAREVWVCNSDGYVGHMCLLSLQSEPIVTLNTPVPGCNSRITCICAVPPTVAVQHHLLSQQEQHQAQEMLIVEQQQSVETSRQPTRQRQSATGTDVSVRTRRRHGIAERQRLHQRLQIRSDGEDGDEIAGAGSNSIPSSLGPHIRIDELRDESEDGYASDSTTDSSSANEDDDEDNYEEEADTEDQSSPSTHHQGSLIIREADRQGHSCSPPPAQRSTLLPPVSPSVSPPGGSLFDDGSASSSGVRDGPAIDASKSTMWLGTEDGCVLIFASSDIIKTTKNKIKVQQNAGVLSIVYLNERVYVSIANGDILVYQRNKLDGCWDCTEPELVLGASTSAAPVNQMLPVGGRLWCACLNDVIVFNVPSHDVETRFLAVSHAESKRGIHCMSVSGSYGVWMAAQGSSKVLLYNSSTYEQLLEVSVAAAVSQKLQSADDIIRQHKMACLRVTSLLATKDQLWVGTSAGVILTLPVPKLTLTTTKSSVTTPNVTGLVYGHTGHVRFLTSVDLSRASSQSSHHASSNTTSSPSSSSQPAQPQQQINSQSSLDCNHRLNRHSSFPSSTSTTATSGTTSQQAGNTSNFSQLTSPFPSAVGMISTRYRPPTPPSGAAAAALAASVTGSLPQQSIPLSVASLGTVDALQLSGWTVVVSGGDGFEDFRPPTTPLSGTGVGSTSVATPGVVGSGYDVETTGKDDSTNHLLIWRVT